jgi:hypothetical protein
MLGYVEKAINRYAHKPSPRPQHAPHAWLKPTYGAATQYTAPADTSAPLDANGTKRLQEIFVVLLYYARAINPTMLVALGTLASAQTKGTAAQLLDYAATHPNAILQYKASDMVIHVHSDASYLSEPNACSRAGGLFFSAPCPLPKLMQILIHSMEPFTAPATVSCATFLPRQRKPKLALCSTIVRMRACYAQPLTNWAILSLLHPSKLIMHAPKTRNYQ